MIRVGRCIYNGSSRVDPSYEGFTNIVVLMASQSKYGDLGPYLLKDSLGRNMENLWQFSKIYRHVPASIQKYSRYSDQIIWQYPAETHVDANENVLPTYWNWRTKGMNSPQAIRYPVGYAYRSNCLCSILASDIFLDSSTDIKILNYIQARKAIYLPLYTQLVQTVPNFKLLQDRLKQGANLLIIEIDGPHQESLQYYKDTYGVNDDFIVNSTLLATVDNLKIMLNDSKHPFGHGYCLASALLELNL